MSLEVACQLSSWMTIRLALLFVHDDDDDDEMTEAKDQK